MGTTRSETSTGNTAISLPVLAEMNYLVRLLLF